MDGTLCDYDGGMRRSLELLCPASMDIPDDLRDLEDVPHINNLMSLIKREPGWWENLEELPIGFQILEMCRTIGFSIHILTKGPSHTPSAWTEKVKWCQKHVLNVAPEAQINIVQNKSMVYGRVLVDDYPLYVEDWLKWRPNGLVLMPRQPWNTYFTHPQVVKVSFDTSIYSLKAMLQEAFDKD